MATVKKQEGKKNCNEKIAQAKTPCGDTKLKIELEKLAASRQARYKLPSL